MSEQTPRILGADAQPIPLSAELDEKACFEKYTALAARVTNLRTILQEPEAIQPGEAKAWAEDVRSVVSDFVILTEETRKHVIRRVPKEP